MRIRAMGWSVVVAVVSATVLTSVATPAHAALPDTSTPTLDLVRTIRTTPFVGTSSSMRDGEGSAYVPNDPAHPNIGGTGSLWLAEDNGRAIWEIEPHTGALKSSIRDATWQATRRYDRASDSGTGPTAGSTRDADFESLAYDRANDVLYAFSGPCCSSSVQPTVYRLRRGADHTFHPDSYQPLAADSDFTASAWNPSDHKVYVGKGSDLRTFDYPTNAAGSTFRVSGVSGILGMSFSDDGRDLFVVNSSERFLRADWAARALRSGWSLDLTGFGVRDSRAVDVIDDQLYVLDGYDGRSSGDPLRYAVFVFDVCCGSPPPSAPGPPVADPGVRSAVVRFAPPSSDGGSPILRYDVTAWPGGATASGATSPITVGGLTPGVAYVFTVTATSAHGTGPASVASAPVVALAARYTVHVSSAEAAQIDAAADAFSIPRAQMLRTGGDILRFFDVLTPGGLAVVSPAPTSSGPVTLTADYDSIAGVAAVQDLAARMGLTTEELHLLGVRLLQYLYLLGRA